jgi:hypothetical protein
MVKFALDDLQCLCGAMSLGNKIYILTGFEGSAEETPTIKEGEHKSSAYGASA